MKYILCTLAALAISQPLSAATVQTIKREFDLHGNLAKEIRNDGGWTEYTYTPGGKVKTRTDDLGRLSVFDYDALKRMTTRTDTANGVTRIQRFDYDGRNRLTKYTDPRGLVTTYTYNGFDEVLVQTSPDSGITTTVPDGKGGTDTVTDAKRQTTKYHYDLAGRLDKLTYADQSNITFGYGTTGTRAGKLQLITDSQGDQISIPYDDLGRPMGEWRTIAGKQYITRENYDSAGRLKQRVYPSGRTITYNFNAAGQVNQILTQANASAPTAVLAKDISYRPFGAAQNWTYGNGELRTSHYDLDGRLDQFSLGDSTVILGYDTAGRIKTQKISGGWWERMLQKLGLPAGQQAQYGYDGYDRLSSWQDGTNNQTYKYDNSSNRTELIVKGKTFVQRVETTSNRLTASDGPQSSVYGYDANGSRTSDTKQNYTYNARGRLIAAAGAQYVVNALGQRIIKTYQGQTTVYHYDMQGHLIAESDQLGNTKREYVYLDDTPIAVIDFGAVRYIHTDHLGTARLITDATKRPIWAWQGEPFGNTPPNEDPEGTGGAYAYNPRFPGQYYDKETGLYYNFHRDYDPAQGRYAQFDPIGLQGGLNPYAYVDNNPLLGLDPYGLYDLSDAAYDTATAVVGFGDTVSFGLTSKLRDFNETNQYVEKCGSAYTGGQVAGVAAATVIGGAAGARAAGTRGAGRVFSHWAPARFFNPKSPSYKPTLDKLAGWAEGTILNGNYVSRIRHFKHDPYAFGKIKGEHLAWGAKWSPWLQQLDRVPNIYWGMAGGAGAGAASMASGSPDCGC
ncbi:RHS repeat protein [Chitinimonas arctica]|uniref:RHS repeat protein n=1 Tax=Chitinimonas arctica TaxID=2594795 RepID=A0A516SG31_9NEIS|nr:RHS repeat-associated core domain-containing protein [Chitinimonas arctica]QDQ27050.1 RHS repeat protein [Chitinimonas arctica]